MSFAEKIFALNSFKRQLAQIRVISVSNQFPNLVPPIREEKTKVDEPDWNNVLSCASALAISPDYEHLDAALRIAQSCLLSTKTLPHQKLSAAVILEKLSNKPAISLAIKRNLLSKN